MKWPPQMHAFLTETLCREVMFQTCLFWYFKMDLFCEKYYKFIKV